MGLKVRGPLSHPRDCAVIRLNQSCLPLPVVVLGMARQRFLVNDSCARSTGKDFLPQ